MALLGDQSRKKGCGSQIIDSDHDSIPLRGYRLIPAEDNAGFRTCIRSLEQSLYHPSHLQNNLLARQVFETVFRRNLCSCVSSRSEFRCRRGAAALGIASGWWIRAGAGSLGDGRWARLAGQNEDGKPYTNKLMEINSLTLRYHLITLRTPAVYKCKVSVIAKPAICDRDILLKDGLHGCCISLQRLNTVQHHIEQPHMLSIA